MLQKIETLISDVLGEKIPEQQDSKSVFMDFIEEARKGIWIVAGELDGSFYCGSFADKLKNKIDNNPLIMIRLLFHKDDDKRKMIEDLKKENKKLIHLFLDPIYGSHIELYWAEKRPIYHFVVADANTFLEEKDHNPRQLRQVYIKKSNIPLSTKYITHFNNMTMDKTVHKLTKDDF